MTYELLYALSLFAFVSSITPGPNNLILLSSGITFGTRRCIRLLLGINLGFAAMILLVGAGIGELFTRFAVLHEVLKWLSAAYILYLAFKVASTTPIEFESHVTAQPMTFFEAVMFQWINPKAWSMSLSAITIYTPSTHFSSVVLVAVVFSLINLPCILSWLLVGTKLSKLIKHPKYFRALNLVLAFVLVASIVPTFIPLD
ncbi:LysE family translocator [Pseudoalteromonas luteoviolacea]|uniref:LysE family translocator n=1 Tax=Pseudoalteromonas luteoviolacea TaxID=43657 RepID=UPI001B387D43|nr:LysE family translocator [Pseudoalteromonas luteoviolacea]MBQ4836551.1 LysE family translocator [Pseudoalteromonas luteoviolacea]